MAEAHPLIITDIGLAKAIEKANSGINADITKFAVSDIKGDLDPKRTTTNRIIYQGQPQVKAIVNDHLIQYSCIIPAGLNPFLIKEVYLFLDDGTLFAIGQPRITAQNPDGSTQLIDYIAYTGQTEKPLLVGVSFTNASSILSLQNVSMDEFEQSAALFDVSMTLGNRILTLRQEIEDLKLAKQTLFKNDREFRQRIEQLEEQVYYLQKNQIALAASFYNLAAIVQKNTDEITKILNGLKI